MRRASPRLSAAACSAAPLAVAVAAALLTASGLSGCQDENSSNSERDTHMGDIHAAAPPAPASAAASAPAAPAAASH